MPSTPPLSRSVSVEVVRRSSLQSEVDTTSSRDAIQTPVSDSTTLRQGDAHFKALKGLGDASPEQKAVIYKAISPHLGPSDRANLMRTEKAANETVGNAPFPGSEVSMNDISKQLQGSKQIGLHGTSAADASSLYQEGYKSVAEDQRNFAGGGQLGVGFYATDGFGPGEVNAANYYANERAQKTGSAPVTLRVNVSNYDQLQKMGSLGRDPKHSDPSVPRLGKPDRWWPTLGQKPPQYLNLYSKTETTFTHTKTKIQQSTIIESGADVVSSQMGSNGVFGNPTPEFFNGRQANQLKLNDHAFVAMANRPAAGIILTPNNVSTVPSKDFLAAVAKRKPPSTE